MKKLGFGHRSKRSPFSEKSLAKQNMTQTLIALNKYLQNIKQHLL